MCVRVCVLEQVFECAPAVHAYNSHLLDIREVTVGRCLSVQGSADSLNHT